MGDVASVLSPQGGIRIVYVNPLPPALHFLTIKHVPQRKLAPHTFYVLPL
jgi:hypothetical protein